MRLLAIVTAAVFVLASSASAQGQRGAAGRGRGVPASAREGAAIDLTGYWVSVISEDWKFRMVTPKKGVYDSLTLNAEGRRVADTWDPAKDEAAGEQCRAYGAANIMRVPGRLHITWQDDNTLRIDTDSGTQTRLLRFGDGRSRRRRPDLARAIGRPVGIRGRGARRTSLREPESHDHEPASGLRAQERRPLQRQNRHHGIFRPQRDAQRRHLVHCDDEGRGSGVLREAVPDDHRFQETARCHRVEARALFGAMTLETRS